MAASGPGQAKVWRALTQGPLLEDWLMANDFEPRVGHRFTFRMPPMQGWNGVTGCEVLSVEPPEELSYTWNASGEEAADGLRTVVKWTLESYEGGVPVRMEQSGFREQDQRNFMGAKYAGSATWANWSASRPHCRERCPRIAAIRSRARTP